jgi:hypothetical protein
MNKAKTKEIVTQALDGLEQALGHMLMLYSDTKKQAWGELENSERVKLNSADIAAFTVRHSIVRERDRILRDLDYVLQVSDQEAVLSKGFKDTSKISAITPSLFEDENPEEAAVEASKEADSVAVEPVHQEQLPPPKAEEVVIELNEGETLSRWFYGKEGFDYITEGQAAKLLGMNSGTLWRRVKDGMFPVEPYVERGNGSHKLYRLSDIAPISIMIKEGWGSWKHFADSAKRNDYLLNNTGLIPPTLIIIRGKSEEQETHGDEQ